MKITEAKRIAKFYFVRKRFKREQPEAYNLLFHTRLLSSVCAHMYPRRVPRDTWTIKKVRRLAKKCKSKSEFKKKYFGAYDKAYKLKIIDKITSHMMPIGNRHLRGLYAFEFPEDKSVYVGLTYNYERRYRQHMHLKWGNKTIQKKTEEFGHEFIMMNIFYPIEQAGKEEALLIEQYKKKGWTILNKAKPGSLGGNIIKWTPEAIRDLASDCSSSAEFLKRGKGAYEAAKKLGIYDEISKHFVKPVRWNHKLILEEAKMYNSKDAFVKGSSGAYNAALRLGVLEEACAHMECSRYPNGYFTIERSLKIAKDYEMRKHFKQNFPTAYNVLREAKLLDKACSHMIRTRVAKGTWSTRDKIHKEALKYKHPSDFKKSASGAYREAVARGWLKYVTSHMTPLGNRYKRGLYVFEFRGDDGKKYAYIGLTGDYEKRYRQHMNKSKDIINKTKEMGHEFIMLNVFYPPEEAAKQEDLLIKSYRKKGWRILNKAKAGCLGGNVIIWTPETLKEEALKFKTRTQFLEEGRGAYDASKKLGIFEEVCAHMPKYSKKWTPEKIQKEALKYKKRVDFQIGSRGAYGAAKKLGKEFLEKVYAHMNPPTKSLTNEELHEIALKYNRKIDFLKNERSHYSTARKRKILQYICSHMKPCYPKLTDEQIHEKALKHKSRTDFLKNDSGAYKHARKRGILDKVCSHMVAPYQYLTDEEVKKKALKYNKRSEFEKGDAKAYDTAVRRKIIKEVCSHMPPTFEHLTNEEVRQKALKYKYRGDFKKGEPKAYGAAQRRGIIDVVCIHMPKLRKKKNNDDRR